MLRSSRLGFRGVVLVSTFVLAGLLVSCLGGGDPRPNILVVMWDTVRADRLGLYGFDKPTTPFLDEWAANARVYEDCVSPANYTIASHASLFTGLYPTEHGAWNGGRRLPAGPVTLAEALREAGYQTFLYSANPNVSQVTGLARGFDEVEHPWSPALRAEAFAIVRGKIMSKDRSSMLPDKVRTGNVGPWEIKASGELAGRTLRRWLGRIDRERPFFAFLNYMEAHRPYIPPEKYRKRVLSDEEVARSYRIDRSWPVLWSYTYGLKDYSEEELDVMAGKYEAAIAELDDLLRKLIGNLEAGGYLENTVVVVTSDHGEHLGEKHMLDHQYSLYEPLLRVPLVVHDPKRFPPGRESRPVMTQDLYRTLLEIAGVGVPPLQASRGAGLLAPIEQRERLSECLGVFTSPYDAMRARYPDWDPGPWNREIRAFYSGCRKLIRWSDGEKKLYRIDEDPFEVNEVPLGEEGARLEQALDSYVAGLEAAGPSAGEGPPLTEEERGMLEALGYLHGEDSSEWGGGGADSAAAAGGRALGVK
ncbi:MAG: sulfatase [Candidatus Eisenbacteria bacterium]